VETKTGPDGQELQHDLRIDRLESKGGKVLYSSQDADMGALDFQDQAEVNWKTSSVLKPAGHFGKYVSVAETTTRFSGGASDATEVQLRTIDTTTGKVVNLSELVSSEDYQKMAASVQAGLNSVQGAHYQQEDMETMDSHMNNGFSLHQDKDGKLLLTVAIPSNVESDGGRVAEFTFSISPSALQ
jgi:hypothetical protein